MSGILKQWPFIFYSLVQQSFVEVVLLCIRFVIDYINVMLSEVNKVKFLLQMVFLLPFEQLPVDLLFETPWGHRLTFHNLRMSLTKYVLKIPSWHFITYHSCVIHLPEILFRPFLDAVVITKLLKLSLIRRM